MPYVHVRITKDGVTTEQKAQSIAEITQTLQRVLGKRLEHTHTIIDEVEPESWGFAGLLTPDFRKQQSSPGAALTKSESISDGIEDQCAHAYIIMPGPIQGWFRLRSGADTLPARVFGWGMLDNCGSGSATKGREVK